MTKGDLLNNVTGCRGRQFFGKHALHKVCGDWQDCIGCGRKQ